MIESILIHLIFIFFSPQKELASENMEDTYPDEECFEEEVAPCYDNSGDLVGVMFCGFDNRWEYCITIESYCYSSPEKCEEIKRLSRYQ